MKHDIQSPIYNIHKSYLHNAEEGPFFSGQIPPRPPSDLINFLGFPVAGRVGIPAGPLLNSKWIKLAADLHYDILCYKTIRSSSFSGHPVPNIVFIDGDVQLTESPEPIFQKDSIPTRMDSIGITNSFGMPSRSPEYLHKDIPKANALLHPGQAMIVSVVGSGESGNLIQDFVDAALLAKDCGAKIIEANFSCPNVKGKEGSLYQDPDATLQLTQKIARAISPIPLIIKVGCYPNRQMLKESCSAIARGGARAIAGINTISRKIVTPSGEPVLGQNRLVSGVCGSPIRQAALQFVEECRAVIDREKLGLTLIGGGGITLPEHFDAFFNAGADFAMTATGMMWNPYLAIQYHQKEHLCLTKN